MKLTPKQIMENPNYYLIAPTAMLGQTLDTPVFHKFDEEGIDTGELYTIAEFIEAGGHTVARYTTDGLMFCKGFCVDMEVADQIRDILPSFGLTYGVDVKLVTSLVIGEELSKPEWNSDEG